MFATDPKNNLKNNLKLESRNIVNFKLIAKVMVNV